MSLLTKLETIQLPAIDTFIANRHFTRGFSLSNNFKEKLLTKIEPAIETQAIAVSKLNKDSTDKPIIKELGTNYLITLGQLFELLKIANKHKLFIAYIKDDHQRVWAVVCHRSWHVGAFPITFPDVWFADSQVFSRDYSEPLSLAAAFTDEEISKLKKLAGLLQ